MQHFIFKAELKVLFVWKPIEGLFFHTLTIVYKIFKVTLIFTIKS